MARALHRVRGFLKHWYGATTRFRIHSPFVHGFVEAVLRPGTGPPEALRYEELRSALLRDKRTITLHDLGAGSMRMSGPQRRVADIARHSLKPPRQAVWLHRMARWAKARHALELGTSFGITSLYIASALDHGQLTTVEGCPATHRIASDTFRKAGATNITAVNGSFEEVLPAIVANPGRLDFVFIDGHHAMEPTIAHFERCLAKAHDRTVLVLDDIHWSRGMEKAWAVVKDHPRVTVTIDLYHMGIVFLHPGQAKEHFRLRA